MHINWGDVPTWLAVVVAAVGGSIALRQLRQQGNVVRDEIDRNKARDALLDGSCKNCKSARSRTSANRPRRLTSPRNDSSVRAPHDVPDGASNAGRR
jgi:hypothetical protein